MRAMQELPFSAVTLGGLLLASVALWFFSRQQEDRRMGGTLAPFAQKHGLTHSGSNELRGVYQQRPLRLRVERRRKDGAPYWVTLVSFDVSDALPAEFSLKRAGAGDALAHLVGGRGDEKIGAEGFDKAFSLTNVAPETRELLSTTTVLEHCWKLNEQRDFHIESGWLHIESPGLPSTLEEFEELVDSVLEAPRALATAAASIRARPSA